MAGAPQTPQTPQAPQTPEAPQTLAQQWRRVELPALLALLFATLVALGVLAGWLRAMHGPGLAAYAPEQGLSRGGDTAWRAVESWRSFAVLDKDGLYLSPGAVLAWFLLVDALVFVPAYYLGGRLVLRRAKAWNVAEGVVADSAGVATLFRWTARLLLALVVFDQAENALTWPVFDSYWDGAGNETLAGLLAFLTLLKWLTTAVVLLAFGVLGLVWAQRRRTQASTTLRLIRVQVVGLVLLALALFMKMQVPDTILTWDAVQYACVVVLTLLLAVTQWALSRHALTRAQALESRRRTAAVAAIPRRFWVALFAAAGLGVVVAVVTGLAHEKTFGTALRDALSGPGALALLAGAVLLLSWLVGAWAKEVRAGDQPDETLLGAEVLPRQLAAAVPVVVGLATLRVTLDTLVLRRHGDEWPRLLGAVMLIALGPVLSALLARLERRLPRGTRWWSGRRWSICLACGALGFVVALASVFAPFHLPRTLSAVGVVLTFLVVATFVAGLLVVAAEWASTRYYLPALFRLLNIRRAPVFAILLVWAAVASMGDSGAHWEVRRRPAAVTAAPAPLTLDGAFDAWLRQRPPAPGTPIGGRPAVPLVIVSASGGGIRAATWTSLAMRCLFEGQGGAACETGDGDVPEAFLASGVSGGSVGLAEYLAHRTSGQPAEQDWVSDHVRGDYVSPQLAWQLFVEVPRSVLHFGADDRAEILERTFERSWGDGDALGQGLVATQTDPANLGRLPVLLMNASSVHDGCWVLSTALRAAYRYDPGETPGTCLAYDRFPGLQPPPGPAPAPEGALPTSVDLVRYLCPDQDVRLSTAGLLSARFPYVSPAGRLNPCGKEEGGRSRDSKYVLDGGDIEASASENAVAAYAALRERIEEHNASSLGTCVVPFFVQLDNGYATSVPPAPVAPPNQLTAPLTSVLSGRGARPERDRALSYLDFAAPLPDTSVTLDGAPVESRYARLVPIAHPGNEPTLGWALSEQSQQDLRDQLGSETVAAEVTRIREWLTGDLRCGSAPLPVPVPAP
jgi:hypothetical protein